MPTNPSQSGSLGKVHGVELLATDNREQRRQKLALVILNSMVQFVGLLATDGTILEMNQAALKTSAVKPSDAEGRLIWDTFWWQGPEEKRTLLKKNVALAASGEVVVWNDKISLSSDGQQSMVIDASLCPVKDERGKVAFLIMEARNAEVDPSASDFCASPQNSDSKHPILVAVEDPQLRDTLMRLLQHEYDVQPLPDGAHAMEAARKLDPALILAMADPDGFALLEAIRKDTSLSGTPFIMITTKQDKQSRDKILRAGADDYLVKSFGPRELLARVGAYVSVSATRKEAGTIKSQAERMIQQSEERLRLAQEAAGIGTWEWNSEERTVRFSAEMNRIFGTSEDDPQLILTWYSRIHPEDLDRVHHTLEEGDRTGNLDFEYRYQHPERGLRWLHCKGGRLSADTRIFGIVLDITESKHAEAELLATLAASQQLAAIVESSTDSIVSKDLNGIITSWNKYAENLFGYTADEMIGRSVLTIIPPEHHDDEQRFLEAIAHGERIEHYETERIAKNGERIQVSLTISPVKDSAGHIVGAAKIARDITQRKKTEQALRTAERLASVGRLAATVAHEINNPLESVGNLVYLARTKAVDPEVLQYLTSAEQELERIFQISKQTLGFYRDNQGTTSVRVGALVEALLPVFGSRLKNKGLTVVPELKADPQIVAIPGEIRQLVANLLNNSLDAVNFGGQIRIRVSSAINRATNEPGVHLLIADSGPGIPLSIRTRLFEPFFTTKKEVGTGLGLWVCRSIVDKHGGRIRIRSNTTPGKSWTVFAIFLPLTPPLALANQESPKAA